MGSKKVVLALLSYLLIVFFAINVTANGSQEKKYYIVYMGDSLADPEATLDSQLNVLSTVKQTHDDAKESMIHSYSNSFNAFAAKLSTDEANILSQKENVVSVIPNGYRKLHTTRSWDFIGLPLTSRRKLKAESDIVVGLLDTGITPGSESFNDHGFGPLPSKWKGTCPHSANFTCNNKLIGARYFKLDGNPDFADVLSPLDVDGHGTHTSSTLAGGPVSNASLFGLAAGTSRGGVPSARIAMYKVCWASMGCSDMDILAAFDAAISDGVDVISISIGGGSQDYVTDSIAVGSFHAMQRNITTIASAGNDGPSLSSVANHAPWIITVAASGIDRAFTNQIQLGNGKSVSGIGVNTFDPKNKLFPLVSGAETAHNFTRQDEARFCYEDAMDPLKVKGKLVFCEQAGWGTDSVIKKLGGIGTIIESSMFLDTAQIFMAPGTMVDPAVGQAIDNYINSTRSAAAAIHKTKEVRIQAPFIASFSSRGPNPASRRVLKPDISAPGIDILASYTELKSLTGLQGDTQFSKFSIMSGTSMACPHVAAVAAYIKSFRPNWSPASIRSAILTTARPMSRRLNADGEFAYGAGQVNPRRALSPGLVYDMHAMQYIQFLCLEGFKDSSIAFLIQSKSVNCSSLVPGLGYDALNYPSFQLTVRPNVRSDTIGIYRRTLTNVGRAKSVYTVSVRAPKDVEITVTPATLSFTRALQRQSFKVVVRAKGNSIVKGEALSGSIVWKSLHYVVRSPVVIYNPFQDDGRAQAVHQDVV